MSWGTALKWLAVLSGTYFVALAGTGLLVGYLIDRRMEEADKEAVRMSDNLRKHWQQEPDK